MERLQIGAFSSCSPPETRLECKISSERASVSNLFSTYLVILLFLTSAQDGILTLVLICVLFGALAMTVRSGF